MPRMDVYEALYTTRAMRRVKPDPIPLEVQKRILDAAVRAPSGGNTQNWRFLLVDDPDVKAAIGPIYRECLGNLWTTYYKPRGYPDGIYRVGPLARLNLADRCGTPLADQELAEFHEELIIQFDAEFLGLHQQLHGIGDLVKSLAFGNG